jgi:hypothetical protein
VAISWAASLSHSQGNTGIKISAGSCGTKVVVDDGMKACLASLENY